MGSDPPAARRALVDAAKAMLPERVPSSVTGRELATAAGVNYGLIHHYFGSKDKVFREALLELRNEFLGTHEHHLPDLILERENPYLRAIGRSQVDYPNELGAGDDFPLGTALVKVLKERIGAAMESGRDIDVEAKARALALLSLQIGYGVYQGMLLDTVGVSPRQRRAVEHELRALYHHLGLQPADAPR